MADDFLKWEERPTDTRFRGEQKFYDILIAKPRLARFTADIADRERVVHDLTSLLLGDFHVSNIGKVKGLVDFAKQENPEEAVFSPEDIALVEHTLSTLEQAKSDLELLKQAEAKYRTDVSGEVGTDKKYNTLAKFLTGEMNTTFSPINITKDFFDSFTNKCADLKAGRTSNSVNGQIAQKLGIQPTDTDDQYQAKVELGKAAIILGKYAEKGVESGIHQDLLIDDSRDLTTKSALEAVRSRLDMIINGTFDKEDPLADEYEYCYGLIQQMKQTGFWEKGERNKLKKVPQWDMLVKALGGIIGTRPHEKIISPQTEQIDRDEEAKRIWQDWEEKYPTLRTRKNHSAELIQALREADPVDEDALGKLMVPAVSVSVKQTPEEKKILKKIKAIRGPNAAARRRALWDDYFKKRRSSPAYLANESDTDKLEEGTQKKKKPAGRDVWVFKHKYRPYLETIGTGTRTTRGLISDIARTKDINVPLVRSYAVELIDMAVTQLAYDDALSKAVDSYNGMLENLDEINMPEESKEEFRALPEQLFDPERQAQIKTSVKNAARLKKFLRRYDLGQLYGSAEGLDAPMIHEILQITGIIPNADYDSSDAYLGGLDRSSGNLVDLVSSVPDTRKSARNVLIQRPELIRSLLGSFDTGGVEEDQKRLDDILSSDDYATRDELLAQYDPKARELNEFMLHWANDLSNYDPKVGFTDEQNEALRTYINKWASDSKSNRGFKEYDRAVRGKVFERGEKWSGFTPAKHLIPRFLDYLYKTKAEKDLITRSADDSETSLRDRFIARYGGLGSDVASQIADAPEISHFADASWGSAFGERIQDYFDGKRDRADDKITDPTGMDILNLYEAFRAQAIPYKARVLLDRFVVDKVGSAVDGEIPVENIA